MPERSRRAFLKLLAAAPAAGVIAAVVGAEAQAEPAVESQEPVWMTTTDPNTGELQLQLLQGAPPITEEQVNAALRQAMSRSGQAPRRLEVYTHTRGDPPNTQPLYSYSVDGGWAWKAPDA